jgi:hypothetical protein
VDFTTIEEIILEQKKGFAQKPLGLPREIAFEPMLETARITVVSGVRRCGKSTLLRQIAEKVESYSYVNFDDERLLNFTVEDFSRLMLAWQKHGDAKVVLMDEIQNVEGWERFVRRIHDEGRKVFLTGSNAKLLASELTTHLTGRYLKVELFPFSFGEFAAFGGVRCRGSLTTDEKAAALGLFDRYLAGGGFPGYVTSGEPDILKQIYDDIVFRDIITRFGIRETVQFRELTAYLFSNFAKETSYGGLAKSLGIKSPMAVRKYVGFLQESYLLFGLLKYDSSYRRQIVANRKVYVIDNGMRNSVAFSASEDRGRLLENAVFIELKRRGLETFYHRQKHECDFVVREKGKITAAIQVTTRLHADNSEREMAGLLEACTTFGLKEGTLITEHEDEVIEAEGVTVRVAPAWKWLVSLDTVLIPK